MYKTKPLYTDIGNQNKRGNALSDNLESYLARFMDQAKELEADPFQLSALVHSATSLAMCRYYLDCSEIAHSKSIKKRKRRVRRPLP